MICFKCNSEEFEVRETNIRQKFRGDDLDITTHVSACRACGWQTLGEGQANELRKLTADAYRLKHHLLTSFQIVLLREARGMSQQAFADYIGVGVASIKRWENGFVQELIYDRLIREKCGEVIFPYAVAWGPEGVVAGGVVFVNGQFSITTHLLNEMSLTNYAMQPIGISSNFMRLTSHMAGRMTVEAHLAESNKNWRKKYPSVCIADFSSCL
jgi:putative zinc finger/helix-turn-helix YgiT family protein